MQVKVKKSNVDGVTRLEVMGRVREILINEDFMNPDKEMISVCFRGKSSSGIIDFTPKELEDIMQAVKGRMHLIKGMKQI